MRQFKTHLFLVVLLFFTTVASAGGYVVILKNGHAIRCAEPLRIEGPNAIITLVTGTITSYPVSQINLVETERYNQQGFGDAVLIEELSVSGTPVPTPTPKMSLGRYASIDSSTTDPLLGTTSVPTPTPTPGIKLQSEPYHDERVDQAFSRIFDDKKLYIYRTSAGTQPSYFFVQTLTDSQREVFHALKIVADAFTLIHRLEPTIAPAAVELQMIQTTGKAAGTFRISADMAAELAENRTTIEQFYVSHVIF
jgi:hypothetical protein